MMSKTSCIIFTLASILILSLTTFIIYLIIVTTFPFNVKFHITNFSLEQFNLTTNNTLYYNFRVNITARNPNNNGKIHYRRITAVAWYKDNDFAWVSLTPFDQSKKSTNLLGPIVFEGNYVINLKEKQLNEYKEETRVGIYKDLAVDLELKIKAKFGGFKSGHISLAQCRRLKVPLISNSESSSPPIFNVTRCKKRSQDHSSSVWILSSRSRSKPGRGW
ncbi:unnamed protein product [Trifolium pratense]|uniref:Uncharacterized protein n=1 Tax=Trifolium pratense TaxID=57577 RepID=A0ACB0J180_TRIPR|nr:unnamed protein product [Trifolium pratense]